MTVNFWLRPLSSSQVSGPYTEEQARERFAAGAFMWPEQEAYTGPGKRTLTLVDTSSWERL